MQEVIDLYSYFLSGTKSPYPREHESNDSVNTKPLSACYGLNSHNTRHRVMHQLTQATFNTLDEVWGSIHGQSLVNSEPNYLAGLWRMAGIMCTAYALQHRGIDNGVSTTMEWLSLICEERQLMALHPSALDLKVAPVKLAVVQSLKDLH